MPKTQNTERFKTIEVILAQGIRSRFDKAVELIDAAKELMPPSAMEGTSAELRQTASHLNDAALRIAETLAYRKIMGID